jgi:hypothetical protein
MGIKSWIFLKDGKPAFLHPSPSQNGWLIDITAAQHVWRIVKEVSFKCLHTPNLNHDPLENTLGVLLIKQKNYYYNLLRSYHTSFAYQSIF